MFADEGKRSLPEILKGVVPRPVSPAARTGDSVGRMLKDKVIVVTGASRGIGEAIARASIWACPPIALASPPLSAIFLL